MEDEKRTIIASFVIGMYADGKNYERSVYSLLDALGDVGGLADAAMFLGSITSYYFTASFNRVEMIERFVEVESQETRVQRPQNLFDTDFRVKLFFFEWCFCLSKCMRKRTTRREKVGLNSCMEKLCCCSSLYGDDFMT